jgi:uncharacterized protein YcsI (UPF0317 family)
MSDVGDPLLPTLGGDIDIRTDLPRYNIYANGEFVEQVSDISGQWNDALVTFVLGCSYSFEEALLKANVPLRHLEKETMPAVYITNIETIQAGPFGGPMVVSMRPFTIENSIKAIEITARFPRAHGAPVHFGDPQTIGIKDLNKPDWGPATEILPGEVPLFWACGVTPQVAIRNARPPICITHAPGCMLITDRDA